MCKCIMPTTTIPVRLDSDNIDLNKNQELSSTEDHELTEEEIDEIISNYRKNKNSLCPDSPR